MGRVVFCFFFPLISKNKRNSNVFRLVKGKTNPGTFIQWNNIQHKGRMGGAELFVYGLSSDRN